MDENEGSVEKDEGATSSLEIGINHYVFRHEYLYEVLAPKLVCIENFLSCVKKAKTSVDFT